MGESELTLTADIQVSHAHQIQAESVEAAAEKAAQMVSGDIHNIILYDESTGAEVYRKYE